MADKDITIAIKTTTDNSGVMEAKRGIDTLIVARQPLEVVKSGFLTAREAEVAEVSRLTEAAQLLKPVLEDVEEEQDETKKSTSNMGMAVLEASRGFEDMQYGISGVLNNIPGLIMMLGGTAGIAGAASAAAVTMSLLGPTIAEFLGNADDTKGLEELPLPQNLWVETGI